MLHVAMYHYVRDLPRTPYPALKGMLTDDFVRQIDYLSENFEMATIESCLEYLRGTYEPRKELCLLTFDDGLKEHFREVTPILADRGMQGLFFVITSCLEDATVAEVHLNHFLMAGLSFDAYRDAFLRKLDAALPGLRPADDNIVKAACRTYPWDTVEVASFKYIFNFLLDPSVRNPAVRQLFAEYIGPEAEFARELYLSWSEAREMQSAGMVIGGHSDKHRPLANLDWMQLEEDLERCHRLMSVHLRPQALVPFSYPYGKSASFNEHAVTKLKHLGFACAFATEPGPDRVGSDLFAIRRVDCKVLAQNGSAISA